MGYEKVPIEFHPLPDHPENALEPPSPLDYNNVKTNDDPVIDNSLLISSLKISQDDKDGQVDGSVVPSSPSEDNNESSDSHERLEEYFKNDVNSLTDILAGKPFTVMMYYGSSENEHFIGPSPLPSMAKQIFECVGPSGKNREYLYNLVNCMRTICPEAVDLHLVELEDAVRELEMEFMLRSPGTPIEL